MILIVAGVSGSGKTTAGAMIAGRLGWRFADADTFHPEANVAKMHAGIPLTDADRQPWLRAISTWMDEQIAAGESAVVTCSALKRAYRDQLLTGRPAATMVFLRVSQSLLKQRLEARHDHFFPEGLLSSQLDELEPPTAGEQRVYTVPIGGDPSAAITRIMATVWPDGAPSPQHPSAPDARRP